MNIKCLKCNTVLTIQENSSAFPGKKVEDNAYCPSCSNLVITGVTDGWFTVRKEGDEKVVPKCTHPMA